MPKLGVNIDHIATLREARKTFIPNPVEAARICEDAGCDSIVCHLREDRRHIKDEDVVILREVVGARLNLEMSIARDIVNFACDIKPDQATLVPERRREVTTEGGLDVSGNEAKIKAVVKRLSGNGIDVSLFINPIKKQIDASLKAGAGIVEFHTGEYANARGVIARKKRLKILAQSVRYALSRGMEVNAGHGLDYDNVENVASIPGMHELNIGHSIISKAVFTGLGEAVRQMLERIG